MAALDNQTSEINDNTNVNNYVDENRNDSKIRSSENADISANGNDEEDADDSDTEEKQKGDEHPEEEKHVFGVKKITDVKVQDGTKYYKVQWADTWEPEYNLYGCMELINEFLEKRKKEKGKDLESEDSVHKGGYCLREKSVVNKKKRKGNSWTSRRIRHKKRKQQNQPLSADVSEENTGQSEQSEEEAESDTTPFGILSPQKTVKSMHKKRLTQKRKKINNLLNGINDFEGDVPEPNERTPSPMDTSADLTPSQTPDAPPTPIPEDTQPEEVNLPTDDALMSESTTVTTTTSSTVTSVVSTSTLTTTPSNMTETSTDISSWQKVSQTTKRNPILLGDDSDGEPSPTDEEEKEVKVKEEPVSDGEEEVLFKRTAKLKASYVIRRLCETGEMLSDEEQDLETFRPDPRLNDPLYIPQEEEDDYDTHDLTFPPSTDNSVSNNMKLSPGSGPLMADLPMTIPQPSPQTSVITCVSIGHPQSPYDRNSTYNTSAAITDKTRTINTSPNNSNIRPTRTQLLRISNNSNCLQKLKPQSVDKNISSPTLSLHNKQIDGKNHVTQTTSEFVIKEVTSTGIPNDGKKDEDDDDDVICLDKEIIRPTSLDNSKKLEMKNALTGSPLFPPRSYFPRPREPIPSLPNKKLEIPLQCNIPIKYLPNQYVEAMISRILWHVKELIKVLELTPSSLPELMQGLILKAVILTIQESYKQNKCEPTFTEMQINDLTQIAFKELPYKRVIELLYNPNAIGNQTLSKKDMNIKNMSSVNHAAQSPKPTSNGAIPITQNTEVRTPIMSFAVPGVRPTASTVRPVIPTSVRPIVSNVRALAPPIVSGGPVPVQFPPMGFLLGQLPMGQTPAGFMHSFMPRFVSGVNPNVMSSRPEIVNVVNSGIRPVSVSQLHSTNNSGNRLPNHVPSELHSLHRLPNHVIANMHQVNRLPTSVYSAPNVRTPITTSLVETSKIVVTPKTVSPPPLAVINNVPRLTSELSTSLPCSITNVRSLKVTQPVEPAVESIDIQDDDVIIDCKNDKDKNTSSSATSISSNPPTSTKISTTPVTPKVKTVLGPHRFYKPPKKPLTDSPSTPNVTTQPNSVISPKLNIKRDQIRYKDLVNQKFAAKPVTSSDKVVDLTDTDVVSLDDSDKEEEKSEEEEKSDKEPPSEKEDASSSC